MREIWNRFWWLTETHPVTAAFVFTIGVPVVITAALWILTRLLG